MVKTSKKKNNGNRNRNGNRIGQRKTNLGRINRSQDSRGISKASRNTRKLSNRVDCLTGSDFIGKVVVKHAPATASERILAAYELSPSAFPGTRVTNLASNWERYKFKKATFRYVPAVPNTIACQLATYTDTDPLDDPSIINDPDALVRQAVAQTGGQQWNFIRPANIPLAMRSDKKQYYTGINRQNQRFDRQGKLYVIQVTTPLDFNGQALTEDLEAGSLYLDWAIDFQTPQIEPEAANGSGGTSDGLFTTVVSRVGETSYTLNLSRECIVSHFESESGNNTQTITVGSQDIYTRATSDISTGLAEPPLGDTTITWDGLNNSNLSLHLISTGSSMLEGIDFTLTGTPAAAPAFKPISPPKEGEGWFEWARDIMPTLEQLVGMESDTRRYRSLLNKLLLYHRGLEPGGWAPVPAPPPGRSPRSLLDAEGMTPKEFSKLEKELDELALLDNNTHGPDGPVPREPSEHPPPKDEL